MNGIKLLGMGRCLPEGRVTNGDLARMVDTSDEWICSRTGIRQRRRCGEETHTQLCVTAARRALQEAKIPPEEVGLVIVATVSPDTLTPAAACQVQRELGLGEDTVCFDLNAACSGFVYGLHVAQCLLADARKKVALVIGCEVLSRLVDYRDRSTCILFGDGAGAAVVKSGEDYPSIHASLGARGDDRVLRVPGPETGAPCKIYMEGSAVFKFAVETVPRCIDAVLTQAGMTVEDVDQFVLHQANERILDAVIRRYHLPPEKCRKNLADYGNTSAASIPILLSELWDEGVLRPGHRVLCVGFGGGLTWGGAVLEIGGNA